MIAEISLLEKKTPTMGLLKPWGTCSLFLVMCYICTTASYNQNLGPSSQPEAYFNGSSYLRLQTSISLKKQTGLSFRTCSGGTLFSQQQSDDLLELSVNSEGVQFVAKTAGKQFTEKILGNFLNNKWHLVVLQYRLGNLTLQVNGEKKLIANSSYRSELLTSPYDDGASVLLIGKQFNGCLLEGPSLVFNSSIITSSPNVRFGECPIPEDSCVPKEDLKGYDYCLTEPCMRHGTCINGQTGYTCTCLPRYTGKNCEIDMGNPCQKSPPVCKNGAACDYLDASGEYQCRCPPKFKGRHCEEEIVVQQQCQVNPCYNGGTCLERGAGMECLCLAGFNGTRCENNIDECTPNPCQHGGVCFDDYNNYTCVCDHTGYTGRRCEVNINECLASPCHNHGTCFDTYGSYLCQCPFGFGGTNCQTLLSECSSQPCLNNAICIDNPDGFFCRCPPGFSGLRCEIEERQALCDITKCPPFADCTEHGCSCKSGGIYPNCSGENICLNNPCKNGGICIPWNGSFNCSCLPGFTGKQCQTFIGACALLPCKNGGTCIEQEKGYECKCLPQFSGPHCTIPKDVCELKPCLNNGTCTSNSPNRLEYSCTCLRGYTGLRCEVNIDDCEGVKCPNGEVCADLVGGYECRCSPGYGGENCTVDVDPCARKPCANGATCQENPITHEITCACPPGFTGNRCHEDVDECETPNICNKGICKNEEGGFQCYCRPGYTGERCDVDFDECLSTPCKNNATCVNEINNYRCECPDGYEGKDCSIDINECESMPCLNGSTCIDGINEFYCQCQPGLTGKICDVNIDDCESSPCLHGAECIDGLNSYQCNCTDTGYQGLHCEVNIDDCFDNPCANGARCIDDIKDYYCKCFAGYTGKNCEEDINECEGNPCKYNGTCLERSNRTLYNISTLPSSNITLPEVFHNPFSYINAAGYECLCIEGVTGENCEIDINECVSNPCFQGTCIDKIGGYYCDCEQGFEGIHCDIDIDECERYRPCVHGKCVDKKANYFCDCEPNYGGKNCSVELTACVRNPCMNQGACTPYLVDESEHRFNCTCPTGYRGQRCEKVTTMSLNAKSIISVNTTREEGYDIQFRFKTTLGDGLLALGKGVTYYILELSKGRLNLHSSLLNKWEGVFIGSNLNDSNWQRVFVAINTTHLVLSANDEQTIYPITITEGSNSTSFPLTYIGGIPSNLKKLTHGQPFLVGCTEDVSINNVWVLPEDRNPLMTAQNVDIGCSREPQCSPNPCHSGGHCTDLWLDFRCTCGRPYLGHTCQYNYTAATFGYENISDSLVTVEVNSIARRAVRLIVHISMFIRTRQPVGQIFYLGSALGSTNPLDETYIAAQLEKGELLVRMQFNGTPEAYTVGGVKLNNGYNHLIEVIRNVTLIQVKLNGTEYFRKTISATGTLDAQVMYLGGQPQQLRPVRQANDNLLKIDPIAPTTSAAIAAPLSNVHFKGIIQDVQISNGSAVMVVQFFPLKAVDLEIPPSFGKVSFTSTVLEGVHSDDSCRAEPCENGVCENTWNDYKCICMHGYKGKNCSDREFCELHKCPHGSECKNLEDSFECIANATFDGKTHPLKYRLASNSSKKLNFDTLEVTYRSRSWGTIFFAKYRSNHFAIFVYFDEVVVEWRINKSHERGRFKRDNFEGQWLTVYFEYKNTVFKGGFKDMVMDEIPNVKVENFDFEGFRQMLAFGDIYIGGSDGDSFDYQSIVSANDYTADTTTSVSITSNSLEVGDLYQADLSLHKADLYKKTDFFKGCLNEIRIGGTYLPFFDNGTRTQDNLILPTEFALPAEFTPAYGCTLCYDSDCFNNGSCVDPNDTYKCECTLGYTADDCSVEINECEDHHCENNSTCIDLIGRYECKCLVGYEGENCQMEIDECLSSPCRNGGTCTDLIGNFKCECPEGFVGKQCEAPLLITCENKPCKEGSRCETGYNEATKNNFTCFCTEGMVGPLCDTPYCKEKGCENGGACNSSSPVPFCECPRGFEGKYCEVNIDDCNTTGSNPCQHGGVCIDGVERFDCNCTGTGHEGLLCELDINECNVIKKPCGDGGKCVNVVGTYYCECKKKGKCGHFCILDDPCEAKPCVHGSCKPKCTIKADYECDCHEDYAGKNCSDYKVAASQVDHVNVLYIVIPIVLIITVGLAVGMAILVNVARSKRATRGTYSPSAQEFCNPRVELDHVLKPPPEERLI